MAPLTSPSSCLSCARLAEKIIELEGRRNSERHQLEAVQLVPPLHVQLRRLPLRLSLMSPKVPISSTPSHVISESRGEFNILDENDFPPLL